MGNITHCMFENTYKDLEECLEVLVMDGIEDLENKANQYEKPYIKKLVTLCKEISDEFSDEVE